MKIDARGLPCPKPVALIEEALKKAEEGAIYVLVDNEASMKNVTRFASKQGHLVEVERDESCWRIKIIKGDPAVEFREDKGVKDTLLVVSTDTFGKDEEIGSVLMKSLFENMKLERGYPHTIFFLNAGVKLTTTEEEIIPLLKDLEKEGVEIFSCGTCLRYYGLDENLQVGRVGGMSLIVDGMRSFRRIIKI